jgi:hypothetical protein
MNNKQDTIGADFDKWWKDNESTINFGLEEHSAENVRNLCKLIWRTSALKALSAEPKTMKPKLIAQQEPWCRPGDKVSVARWDQHERDVNKLGSPATVVRVDEGQICESGVMVGIVGSSGKQAYLSMNWLAPFTEQP